MSAYNAPQPLPQFDISSFSMTPSTGGSAYPPPSLNLPVFDKSAFPAETTAVEATVPASFTNTQIGTGTLNTNNIQPLTAADVNLYTTITSGVINLGSSILAQLKIYSAWVTRLLFLQPSINSIMVDEVLSSNQCNYNTIFC